MDALPVEWEGTLVMLDHLYGFVSVIEDMKRSRLGSSPQAHVAVLVQLPSSIAC